jgi:hypothetical protein
MQSYLSTLFVKECLKLFHRTSWFISKMYNINITLVIAIMTSKFCAS